MIFRKDIYERVKYIMKEQSEMKVNCSKLGRQFKNNSRPGVLIELKSKKDLSKEQLDTLAQEALNQINERQYDTEMKTHGITTIFRYGAAFSGKNVAICSE